MQLLSVFVNIVLPVVIVVACGNVLQRVFSLDVKSVSRVAFYAFSPCLVFSSLAKSSLGGTDAAGIWSFVLAATVIMCLLSWGMGRLLRLGQLDQSAFILSTAFGNNGNFGLPVLLFAFGQPGLERGVLYYVGGSLLINTLGVFVASRGRADVRASLKAVFSVPVLYAVVLALLFNAMRVQLPEPLLKPIKLLGDAAVATMELLLGMQLARALLQRDLKAVLLASFMAIVVSAGVGFGLAGALGLRGLTRQVCIVEAGTPTAVTSTLLATEFDTHPEFVTSVVLVTTVASVLTTTLLLSLVM